VLNECYIRFVSCTSSFSTTRGDHVSALSSSSVWRLESYSMYLRAMTFPRDFLPWIKMPNRPIAYGLLVMRSAFYHGDYYGATTKHSGDFRCFNSAYINLLRVSIT